jgi:hypothetical protein
MSNFTGDTSGNPCTSTQLKGTQIHVEMQLSGTLIHVEMLWKPCYTWLEQIHRTLIHVMRMIILASIAENTSLSPLADVCDSFFIQRKPDP